MTCSICLRGIDKDMLQLPCKHCFHTQCILPWFRSSNRSHGCCPECRNNPYNSDIIHSSATIFQIAATAAKRKDASASSKQAHAMYVKKRLDFAKVKKEERAFRQQNANVVKEMNRLKRKVISAQVSLHKSKKTVCRLHPIVPILVNTD